MRTGGSKESSSRSEQTHANLLNTKENIIVDEAEVVDKLCHCSIERFFLCYAANENCN